MPPQQQHDQHINLPEALHAPQPHQIKSSKGLTIALVAAAVFLLVAGGVTAWLLLHKPAGTVQNKPADDAVGVTKVSFVVPADMPAAYVKNDQSTLAGTTVYYYDDSANCGVRYGVIAVPTDKADVQAVVDTVAATETQGVTTTSTTTGKDTYTFKDADGKHTYTFASEAMNQDVSVPGVTYTKQSNVLLYKQFGNQIAWLGYTCKSDTWASKKDELTAIAKKFTVKTER